jgi:hypothetical protein
MPQQPLSIVKHEPLTIASSEPLPAEPKTRTWGDTARDLIPTVGGTIGALAGGPVGSAIGGAAGSGYRELAEHATELPGALADIARNWREAPAMARGALRGVASGALDAGKEAAIQGVSTVAGNAITKGAQTAATGLMQSALKPGIRSTLAAVKGGQVPPVVQTLLKEGVNVTPGGIEKLNRIISASNDDIATAIGSLSPSANISPLAVTSRLSPLARSAAKQVNPADDLSTISNVGQEFLDAHGARAITPQAAQEMKKATYRALGEKSYGELKGTAIEAQKALARGLKEEIAAEAQKAGIDLAAMNAREGAAITARDAIAKRVAQVGNRDPAGLAWLAHSPVTFVMALAERSPAVKTLLARGLYQSAAKAANVPAETLRWAMGAIASASQEPE